MLRIFKCEYLENDESKRKIRKNDMGRCRYLSSNWTIANVVLHDLDLDFQGHTLEVAIFMNERRYMFIIM